jgi:hypothetical protein
MARNGSSGVESGGPQVFLGNIASYSGEWDARDRVGRIHTNKCLLMLAGEYDHSCAIVRGDGGQNKGPRSTSTSNTIAALPLRGTGPHCLSRP